MSASQFDFFCQNDADGQIHCQLMKKKQCEVCANQQDNAKETIAELYKQAAIPIPKATVKDPLSDLAALILHLTYGEMMELSEGLWRSKELAAIGEKPVITVEDLPKVLHMWSKNYD
jgi:hypothetical protein